MFTYWVNLEQQHCVCVCVWLVLVQPFINALHFYNPIMDEFHPCVLLLY